MITTEIPVQEYIDLLKIKVSYDTALHSLSGSEEFNKQLDLDIEKAQDKILALKLMLE